jgi:hypothetical protein
MLGLETLFCTRDVFVRAHNGGINHHPCHIPILRQRVENHLPNSLSAQRLKRLWILPYLPYSRGRERQRPPLRPTQITPSTKR